MFLNVHPILEKMAHQKMQLQKKNMSNISTKLHFSSSFEIVTTTNVSASNQKFQKKNLQTSNHADYH